MRKFAPVLISLSLVAAPAMAKKKALELTTDTDKTSYSIGVDIGKNFREQNIEINMDAFTKGIEHGSKDKPYLLSEEDIRDSLLALQTRLVEQQNEKAQKVAQENLEKGKAYLESNKQKDGVKVTDSGLQYKVIEEGKGESPKANSMVTTHYRGTFIDGQEFDSSYSRGEPVQFNVSGVIPAWTEALQMMKPGAKWEIVAPADLAYGEHGVGNVIPANATLVFEIELLSVDSAQPNG